MQGQVEKQVEGNRDLLSRLEHLETTLDHLDYDEFSVFEASDVDAKQHQVPDATDADTVCPSPFPQPDIQAVLNSTDRDAAGARIDVVLHMQPTDEGSLKADPRDETGVVDGPRQSSRIKSTNPRRFEVILSTTRVYNRVRHRVVDDATSITSTRSRGWSVLSGLSLARISITSVVNLPLSDAELKRFLQLAAPQQKRTVPRNPPTGMLLQRQMQQPGEESDNADFGPRKVAKELDDLQKNPPKSVFAEPITDDMVSFLESCNSWSS